MLLGKEMGGIVLGHMTVAFIKIRKVGGRQVLRAGRVLAETFRCPKRGPPRLGLPWLPPHVRTVTRPPPFPLSLFGMDNQPSTHLVWNSSLILPVSGRSGFRQLYACISASEFRLLTILTDTACLCRTSSFKRCSVPCLHQWTGDGSSQFRVPRGLSSRFPLWAAKIYYFGVCFSQKVYVKWKELLSNFCCFWKQARSCEGFIVALWVELCFSKLIH